MFTPEEHLDNLLRHLDMVRDNCVLLGKRLISQGRKEFGLMLIRNGHIHDASKFAGIEWDFLHVGEDVDRDDLMAAIKQHCKTNLHHPEHWGGIENMPEIYVAEMVADWYARSQEMGTNLREWYTSTAVERFKIDPDSTQHRWIVKFVDLLLTGSFKKV